MAEENEGKIKVEVKTEEESEKETKSRNPWIYSTALLIVIIIAMSGIQMTGMFTAPDGATPEAQISPQDAGQKAVDFINKFLLSDGVEASLVSVTESDEYNLYNLTLEIQGTKVNSLITMDGIILFPTSYDIDEISNQLMEPQEPQQPTEFSEEDLEKLSGFVACLEEKGMRIYGANWCGWTQKLITSLGGFEMAAPIYIECTEETETCQQEGVSGYPTIKINGEPYEGSDRNLASLAEETGCTAPLLEGNPTTENSGGSCG